jgi:Enoyl-(Acyl carrier protein) reductase
MSGITPESPTGPAYSAAKAAVIHLTRYAALEAAPLGITVNTVAPGLTDTPAVRADLTAEQIDAIPIGRLGNRLIFLALVMSSVSFPSVGNSLYWGPPGFFYCREHRNGLKRLQAAALSRWFWLPSGQRNPFPARDAVADQPQRWLEAAAAKGRQALRLIAHRCLGIGPFHVGGGWSRCSIRQGSVLDRAIAFSNTAAKFFPSICATRCLGYRPETLHDCL